jgi:putrescine aminotransferase
MHNSRELRALDAAHYMHPFTDTKALAESGTRIITKASGIFLEDIEGRRILDGMSGLWCVAMGYGRRDFVDVACRQMLELPYYNSFFQCTHPPGIELARKLVELTPPQFNHAFFTGSGSESNDTIVRMVRRYWDLKGEPQRSVIISRWNAYHGSTMAGASLGGMKAMHGQGGLPIPDIVHIEQPYWYECGGNLTPMDFGLKAAQALEDRILAIGPNRVAAFIGEPVQGAGGVIIPAETYWPAIQRIVDKYGILLISDEVICGFGRTGQWFGCQHYGTKPDFLALAKAITSGYFPLGAVMVGDRVANTLIEKGGEFYHGFTYSGHPAGCAVALANLNAMQKEGIVDQVRVTLAPYWNQRWKELEIHPLVGEARCLGLLGAIELVPHKPSREFFPHRGEIGRRCRDICIRNGLMIRAVWDTIIAAPPLIISKQEIDQLISTLLASLNELQAQLHT